MSEQITAYFNNIATGVKSLITGLSLTFEHFKKLALGKGFLLVSATPLTRSSYHAGEDFRRLQTARNKLFARS